MIRSELYKIGAADHGNTHYSDGWVNVHCPFCSGSQNYHLGWNMAEKYFTCYRCGFKNPVYTLTKLLNITKNEAINLLKESGSKKIIKREHTLKRKKFKVPPYQCELDNLPLHQKYLTKRGFDWKFIKKNFNVTGTKAISSIDDINLKFRLIIPIQSYGKTISWTTRDVSGNSNLKYISCPKEREIIEHKTTLYQHPNSESVVLCEGVFDVWKVQMAGYNSTCCFGIKYTPSQIQCLLKYKKVIIFFDSERQAKRQAKKISKVLNLACIETKIINCPPGIDAGDMDAKQIQNLIGIL